MESLFNQILEKSHWHNTNQIYFLFGYGKHNVICDFMRHVYYVVEVIPMRDDFNYMTRVVETGELLWRYDDLVTRLDTNK